MEEQEMARREEMMRRTSQQKQADTMNSTNSTMPNHNQMDANIKQLQQQQQQQTHTNNTQQQIVTNKQKQQFIELLGETQHLDPFGTFETQITKVDHKDQRYNAIANIKEKRALFVQYIQVKAAYMKEEALKNANETRQGNLFIIDAIVA
jgi:hypothetical protein